MSKRVPIPDSISEHTTIHGTVLERRWRKSLVQLAGLTLFCIAWDAFLVFWYFLAFTTESPWIMKVFPIAHLGVGIGLTYYLVAAYLNRTDITVSSGQLEIKTHPVPWLGNKTVNTSEIAQLYITEDSSKDSYGKVSRSYELHMIDHGNKQRTLIKGLESAQEALYLEKRLEEILNITSEPVAGAYTG